jgi:hypothetical protein
MKLSSLLDGPSKWMKGTWGKTPDGATQLNGMNPSGICWCIDGAIQHCYKLKNGDDEEKYKYIISRVTEWIEEHHPEFVHGRAIGSPEIIHAFNDASGTSWEDVQQMMDDLHL